ncbi:MAG: 1,6-anhydro-N-acetylmuramyl-L-alanine amidase AmpD, partial [Comamonadaceae bacterium]
MATTARPAIRRSRPVASGLWQAGWYRFARRLASPNFGPRPEAAQIDLIVLHSISLPPGRYGGDEVQQFFTNQLDWN